MIEAVLLATQLSAGAIVAHAKEADLEIRDLSARAHMEILREGEKKERVFDILLRREGVNYKALISLVEPLEMAGTRFLVIAERGKRNRQWAYFPDLDLVRSIAGRSQDDPFLGSDISYSDLAGGAHLDDLLHRLVGEEEVDGQLCYVMEGIPRHRIVYGKLQGWVRKEDFATVRARFFDQEGRVLKEATLGQFGSQEGALLAHRIEMQSLTEDSQTVLRLEGVRINQGLAPDRFTADSLRGSPGR